MENNINSFTFYRDYYNLVDTMPDKDKKELLVAITDYVFKDVEPKLTGHNQAIFNTLKNQLNVSKNNSKRSTKQEPKENRKETENKTKIKPNAQPKENKTSVLSFKFYISNFKFINTNNLIINKLEEWFKYKQERKEYYKETGLKSLLKKIDLYIEKYGYQKVIDLIDTCMANNYAGIIWDILDKGNFKKEETIPQWFNEKIESKERELTEDEQRLYDEIVNGN